MRHKAKFEVGQLVEYKESLFAGSFGCPHIDTHLILRVEYIKREGMDYKYYCRPTLIIETWFGMFNAYKEHTTFYKEKELKCAKYRESKMRKLFK